MNNILISKPLESDSEYIKNLLRNIWIETYKDYIPENIIFYFNDNFHSIERLNNQIKDKNVFFRIVKINDEIIGTISLKKIKEGEYSLDRIYINSLFQGKGIGKKLLNDFLENNDVKKITLEVLEKNKNTIDFYKKLGFIEIGKNSFEIEDFKIMNIVMEKSY